MSKIRVLEAGLQTTIQDLGRLGWAHYGVSASGAADPLALRAANLLVGNAENAAALEMTLKGGAFEFEAPATIAITGSDFGSGLPLWTPVEIAAGQTVRFGATRSGARAYLAVRGGLDVPLVMGSASVHVMTCVGGRPLRAGDTLAIGNAAGQIFISTALDYTFPLTAMLGWLGLVLVISVVASFYPAWSAARLTVREVLAYE